LTAAGVGSFKVRDGVRVCPIKRVHQAEGLRSGTGPNPMHCKLSSPQMVNRLALSLMGGSLDLEDDCGLDLGWIDRDLLRNQAPNLAFGANQGNI